MPKKGKVGFGPGYLDNQLTYRMEKLRGQLYNLADSITDDRERREAIKGLINDFTSYFWSGMGEDISEFLIEKEIIKEVFPEPPDKINP